MTMKKFFFLREFFSKKKNFKKKIFSQNKKKMTSTKRTRVALDITEDDVWDDTLLMQAYDAAVRGVKHPQTKEIVLPDEEEETSSEEEEVEEVALGREEEQEVAGERAEEEDGELNSLLTSYYQAGYAKGKYDAMRRLEKGKSKRETRWMFFSSGLGKAVMDGRRKMYVENGNEWVAD